MASLVHTESITDPKQASLMLEQRRQNVLSAYTTLHKIVERHEATIQKRWLGKTRQARLKILLTAWPNMPLLHRPDLKAFRQVSNGDTRYAQWQRAVFLWPHINQEDLTKSRTLLLLLNARSRHDPRVFAETDTRAPALGMLSMALLPQISLGPDYQVKMGDASTLQEYGKLQRIDALPYQTTQSHVLPSQAFLVLKVQERILKFLADVCRLVLHDIDPSAMINDEVYPVQPEPRLTTEASIGPFESMAAVAAEANYRVPGSPNFDQMESLFAAKSAAIKDRISALREDPAFFAAALQDVYDHSIQHVKLSDGSEHPDLKGSNGNVLWVQAIKQLVASLYIRAGVYAELCLQSRQLRTLFHDVDAELSEGESGRALQKSEECVYALSCLRYYLTRAISGSIADLHQYIHSSPLMRNRYMLLCDGESKAHGDNYLVPDPGYVSPYATGSTKANAASLFLWSLNALRYDEPVFESIGVADIVDEIQRTLSQENIGSEMITPFIASIIGDLSVLTHCYRMLRHVKPFSYDVPQSTTDAVARKFDVHINPLHRLVYAMDVENVLGAASLVNPSHGRFAYPVDKRRTKETVEAMQRAEQNLEEFWAYIDRAMYLKAGNLHGTALEELFANPKARRRTQKWVGPSAAMAAATAAMAGAHASGNSSSDGNSNGKTSGGGKKKKKGGNKAAAAKANANAAAAAPIAGSNTAASTADSAYQLVPLSSFFYDLYKHRLATANGANGNGSHEANGTTIPVDPRTLKVFRALYFHPDVNSTFGGILWNDFVNAMSSVGFQAEKMYGSLWHFRPAKKGVAGVAPSASSSIIVYEPFSQTKMSLDGARWIGRRLTRAYGWNRDTFVAKGK